MAQGEAFATRALQHKPMADEKRVLVAGASGLIGGYCLHRLLAHPAYSRVIVWSRRALPLAHEKLSIELVDFDDISGSGERFDEVFCCLGTTIRTAGSKQAFRRVDYDYPLALARLAKAAGAKTFLMVSALGANPDSPVFYNRVKGEVEREVAAIGLPRAIYFRPSLLLGPRQESRPGEKVGIVVGNLIAPLLTGRLARYRPIHADAVAAAMVHAANDGTLAGAIESDAIARLAVA
jgi:uncharacterized protein YbjT (DUF2867 family)